MQRFRKKSFWISLAAGVTLLLQLLGVKVDVPYVNEIVSVASGILMLIGVILPSGEKEVFGYELCEVQDDEQKPSDEKDKFTNAD